jgi:hypothetical protein
MKKILLTVFSTLAAISLPAAAFTADSARPVVPSGPIYVYAPPGETQNDAEKAANKREIEETKRAVEKADTESREAEKTKAEADIKAAGAKTKADAAAKDAVSPAAR